MMNLTQLIYTCIFRIFLKKCINTEMHNYYKITIYDEILTYLSYVQ